MFRKAILLIGLATAILAQSIQVRVTPAPGPYRTGQDLTIHWTYSGIPSNALVKITIWREGGTQRLCRIAQDVAITRGSFPWHIPDNGKCLPPGLDPNNPSNWEDLTTTRIKIRVRWQGSDVWGETYPLRIVRGASITVNHVVGYPGATRDSCMLGQECEVRWDYSGFSNPSEKVQLLLFRQGGTNPICSTSGKLSDRRMLWRLEPSQCQTSAGTHFIKVRSYSGVEGSSPSFNLQVPPLPDLYVSSITFNDAGASRPDECQVTVTVSNLGTAQSPAAQGKITITRPGRPPEEGTGNIPPIPAGGSYSFSMNLYMGDGTNTVKVELDPGNNVMEISETNNVKTASHEFYYKGLPVIHEFTASATRVNRGTPVTLHWKVVHADRVIIFPLNRKWFSPHGTAEEWEGDVVVHPYTNTTYTLRAILTTSSGDKFSERQVQVRVFGGVPSPNPMMPRFVLPGEMVAITWKFGNRPVVVYLCKKGTQRKIKIGTFRPTGGKLRFRIPAKVGGGSYYLILRSGKKSIKTSEFNIKKK